MTPQLRSQYRPKTGGRWRTVNPDNPPAHSDVAEIRIHPDDQQLFYDQTHWYWIWVRLDDYPSRGFTTSVQVAEESSGWVITDLCISRSLVQAFGDPSTDQGPWLSNGIIWRGANESGVTPAILKRLRISEIRRAILDRLEDVNEPYFPIRTDSALEALRSSMTGSKRHKRDPLAKARLAAAYEALTRSGERAGNRVHADLAAEFDPPKSPHTITTYVRELRTEGYLTSAGAGRVGGAITDKAREILRQAGDL